MRLLKALFKIGWFSSAHGIFVAVVATVALPTTATNGAVVLVPTVTTVSPNSQVSLDFNADGQPDFALSYALTGNQTSPYAVQVTGKPSQSVRYPTEKLVYDQFTSKGLPFPVGSSIPVGSLVAQTVALPVSGGSMTDIFAFQLSTGSLGFF